VARYKLTKPHTRRLPREEGVRRGRLHRYEIGDEIEVNDDEAKRLRDRLVPVSAAGDKAEAPESTNKHTSQFANMTKKELLSFAEESGIGVDKAWKVAKLRSELQEAVSAKPEDKSPGKDEPNIDEMDENALRAFAAAKDIDIEGLDNVDDLRDYIKESLEEGQE
jgi:hypothetical protein